MASFLSLLLLLLSFLTTVTSIPESDLQLMLSALRSRGYNLFGNSITISDIHHDLLAGPSFTFLAPTDGSLFSLEIASSPSLYLSTLRYHIVPRKYSVSDLLALRSGSTLATLLPHHNLTVATEISPASEVIKADAVDVVLPGLYYGRNIAVHGLNGILDHRHLNRLSPDLEQISPESQSSSELKPSEEPEFQQSLDVAANVPISPVADTDLDDYLPESRASSPEILFPRLKSPDAMSSVYGEEAISTRMPPLSYAPQQSQCPDPGEGCGEMQSESRESGRFEVESRCDMMMMTQGGVPARAPGFSPAPNPRNINGKDL